MNRDSPFTETASWNITSAKDLGMETVFDTL